MPSKCTRNKKIFARIAQHIGCELKEPKLDAYNNGMVRKDKSSMYQNVYRRRIAEVE